MRQNSIVMTIMLPDPNCLGLHHFPHLSYFIDSKMQVFTFNTTEIRMYLSTDGTFQLELHFLLLFQNNGASTVDGVFDLMYCFG